MLCGKKYRLQALGLLDIAFGQADGPVHPIDSAIATNIVDKVFDKEYENIDHFIYELKAASRFGALGDMCYGTVSEYFREHIEAVIKAIACGQEIAEYEHNEAVKQRLKVLEEQRREQERREMGDNLPF